MEMCENVIFGNFGDKVNGNNTELFKIYLSSAVSPLKPINSLDYYYVDT